MLVAAIVLAGAAVVRVVEGEFLTEVWELTAFLVAIVLVWSLMWRSGSSHAYQQTGPVRLYAAALRAAIRHRYAFTAAGMLVVVAAVFLYPFVWLVTSSLKDQAHVFDNVLIPDPLRLNNYVDVWQAVPLLLCVRWSRVILRKPRRRGQYLATLPMQLVLFGVWSAGEGVGYLFGRGLSCRRLFY